MFVIRAKPFIQLLSIMKGDKWFSEDILAFMAII